MSEEKRFALKCLFGLPKEDILDILEVINGYKTRANKSDKDTVLMRCVFMNGYHSMKEFWQEYNITKDQALAIALNYESVNIKAYLKLKNILNIDDFTFKKILNEIELLDRDYE